MINTRKITCRIIDITKKADKNDNNYLILEEGKGGLNILNSFEVRKRGQA